MPVFQAFYDEYQDLGLVILGVNLRESESTVRNYTEEIGVTYPIVLDRNGEIAQYFRVVGPPVTLFIGRDGEVVKQFIGEVSRDQLSEFLAPMMMDEAE
jgi:peroxiredoxin